MGRVRTKTVKTTSRQVVDFHTNKKVLEEVSILPSKRLRNNLTRRISLKLQEELDFLFLKRMALLGSLMAFEVQPCSIPSPPMLFCFHRRVHVSELFPTCDGYHHLRTASEAHVADATAAAAAAAYRQYAQLGNNINYLTFSNTVCSIPRTAIWLPFVA